MFCDSSIVQCFLVDRETARGRTVRRVVVVCDDGSIVFAKTDGEITRMIHVSALSHVIYAAKDGVAAAIVLLRTPKQHDVLFTHALDYSRVRNGVAQISEAAVVLGPAARSSSPFYRAAC